MCDETQGFSEAKRVAGHINRYHANVSALPGFEGKQAVVRLAMPEASNAEEAEQTLQHIVKESSPGEAVPTIECQQPETETLIHRLRGYSGPMASLTWLSGNLMMLAGAINGGTWQPGKPVAHVHFGTASAATAYALANGIVLLNANQKQRSTTELLQDMQSFLEAHHAPPLTSAETASTRQLIQQVGQSLRRYPWEIAAAVNMFGALLNMAGSLYERQQKQEDSRNELVQAAGALAGFSAGLAQLLVPQPSGERWVDPEVIAEMVKTQPVLQPLETLYRRLPLLKKAGEVTESLLQDLSPHRLKMIAGLGSIDNIGLLVSALMSHPVNKTQASSQGIAALGYGFQALARDVERLDPEAAMFCTAVMMEQQLRGLQEPDREKAARNLAKDMTAWLQQQPDIAAQWPDEPAAALYTTWQQLSGRRGMETAPAFS